jgi:hypothetical protein
MRNAGRKREIRRTRDLIRIRLAFRRKKLYRYKVTPNEIKDKNAIIIFEKAAARIIENPPNTSLNTRKAFRKYFKNKEKKK